MSSHHEAVLPLQLKQLGLPTFYQHWQSTAQVALDDGWSYAQYLRVLSDKEVAIRYQKRVQRHTKEAKLPVGKTLDAFDFMAAKTIDRKVIDALANSTAWTKEARNVILFGPSGVGKSHLAAAIGYRLIEQGVRVLFTKTTTLVQHLQKAKQQYALAEAIAKLARYPVLILDDIGYVKKDEMESSVLFELIADRYETKSLIVTTNHGFDQWDSIFPDTTMTVAAVDRLVHHASIINIEEKSYRSSQADQQIIT